MRLFLLSLPSHAQAIVIIGVTLMLAFMSAIVCGFFFDSHLLAENTDLISAVYQVMGTVYAILLTFTLWGVWQNYMNAGAAVQTEAYALLNLVHMDKSAGRKDDKLRKAALAYATMVVEKEWPTLKDFTSAVINFRERTHSASLEVIHTVESFEPKNHRESTIFAQTLSLLTEWLDARRTRILIARGNSAKALWPLLLTGAFVLFAFHGLFVAKAFIIWIALLFGIALVIGVTFYLIFSLDCPFGGAPSIDSEPFALAINILNKYKS